MILVRNQIKKEADGLVSFCFPFSPLMSSTGGTFHMADFLWECKPKSYFTCFRKQREQNKFTYSKQTT